MSFLSDFEARIGSVFGAAPQGYTEPFSFKKLAKRAAKEMENETYEIDGVDTAPALYTILVSAADDSLMRPLYEQITYETSTFVTAQAQKKGYAFVGNPLVRFMVDPGLKSGKFVVFAENVDAGTLNRLRQEEREFLAGNSSAGGAAAQVHPRGASRPATRTSAPSKLAGEDSGLDVMPLDILDSSEPDIPLASPSASTPMPVPLAASTPMVGPGDTPGSTPVPQTQGRNVPLVDPRRGVGAFASPGAAGSGSSDGPRVASCLLIDRQSGRTYTAKAPSTVIGRESSQAGIVLRDPNISRRHAELSFDGRDWCITDLGSTNGTLVNDVDVSACTLRDGDLITFGLLNLEFRENPR